LPTHSVQVANRAQQDENLFLHAENSSDVIFVFEDGTELHGHRLILSHRSLIFRTLLDNEARSASQEEYSNSLNPLRVHINSHSLSIFKEIVRYVYCGHVRLNNNNLIGVIQLAKVYQMYDLVSMLSHAVVDALDCENVCDILRTADECELVVLREHCMSYFQRHRFKIFETSAYVRFKEDNPALGMKVLEELMSRPPIGWYWINKSMRPREESEEFESSSVTTTTRAGVAAAGVMTLGSMSGAAGGSGGLSQMMQDSEDDDEEPAADHLL